MQDETLISKFEIIYTRPMTTGLFYYGLLYIILDGIRYATAVPLYNIGKNIKL